MTDHTHQDAMASFWAKQAGLLDAAASLLTLVRSNVTDVVGLGDDPMVVELLNADDRISDAHALVDERAAGR